MEYPKINGEELNQTEKNLFDFWYKKFVSSIKITGDSRNLKLSKQDIEVLTFNCVHEVASYRHLELKDVGKVK